MVKALDHVSNDILQNFEQKQRYGCTDQKIYRVGLNLNGPEDPMIRLMYLNKDYLRLWAENPSKLADEIPFCYSLYSFSIDRVAPELQAGLLRRFIDLVAITVIQSVQDIKNLLELLKSLDNIVNLCFKSDQPQELFDRLAEHSVIQRPEINRLPTDPDFLFRPENLVILELWGSIDLELVCKLFEELPFFFQWLLITTLRCRSKSLIS